MLLFNRMDPKTAVKLRRVFRIDVKKPNLIVRSSFIIPPYPICTVPARVCAMIKLQKDCLCRQSLKRCQRSYFIALSLDNFVLIWANAIRKINGNPNAP